MDLKEGDEDSEVEEGEETMCGSAITEEETIRSKTFTISYFELFLVFKENKN